MSTTELLRCVGYPQLRNENNTSSNCVESHDLYEIARKNKIGSMYVKSLSNQGKITKLQEEWIERSQFREDYLQTLKAIKRDFPPSVNYAVVKSMHPFWFDSKDVDVVVFDDSLEHVIQSLQKDGYELIGTSPTSADLAHPETQIQIDIQDGFSLQKVIYFDKESLRNEIQQRHVGSTTIPVASSPSDLALIVIHSITEQLFILKDFFASVYSLEDFSNKDFEEFLKIVRENQLGPACGAFFTIVDELCIEAFDHRPPFITQILTEFDESSTERASLRSTGFNTPHRYTVRTGISTVASKLRHQPFTASLLEQIPRLASPSVSYHILTQLFSRRTREHYMHDMKESDQDTQ